MLCLPKGRWFWSMVPLPLALLCASVFLLVWSSLAPPPDYQRIEIGMTTEEVGLALGDPWFATIPHDIVFETGWNQRSDRSVDWDGDDRIIHVRIDHGRIVEKKWWTYADYSAKTPWERLRYRFWKAAALFGLVPR